jgi:hypothetical protein
MTVSIGRAAVYGILGTTAAVVVLGVPTALIPNPIFGRMVPPDRLDYGILVTTAVLSGILAASYAWSAACPLPQRRLTAGALASFFAIGCPTCNKLVLLLLGTSGALQWFAPVQPLLGLLGIGLLVWAVVYRFRLLRQSSRAATVLERSPL